MSAWENELFDGRDASIGLGLDAGLRVNLIASDWARIYAGGHYLKSFGYDSYVRSSYDGPSFVAGVQIGKFR